MSLLVRAVRVWTSTDVVAEADVLVADGLITAVGPRLPAPAGVEVVQGRGRTLLPGLIDAHMHITPGAPEQALAFGVTTVLDMVADPVAVARLRAESVVHQGMAQVFSAGTGATVPGGYPWNLVDMGFLPPFPTVSEPGQAAGFVADRVAEGSDYLKILIDDGSTTGTPVPELPAVTARELVQAARSHDRLTVAHALTVDAAERAVRAGVDVLGHLYVDRPADPDFPSQLGARGVVVIPTLGVLYEFFGSSGAQQLLDDPLLEPYLDGASRQLLSFGQIPLSPAARHQVDVATRAVSELRDAGVPLLAGSDSANPGIANGASVHRELELLVAAGLTPVEALSAATATPARVFGLGDRGRIAPGLRADLLLVQGDPTASITATRDIVAIWRGGQRFDREAYRAGLS